MSNQENEKENLKNIEQINDIKNALDFIDDNIEIKKPAIGYFKHMVSETEKKKRAWKNIELILFLMTAFILLNISAGALILNFTFYMILQAVALVIVPTVIFIWFKCYFGKVNS